MDYHDDPMYDSDDNMYDDDPAGPFNALSLCGAWDAAQAFVGGQGFEPLSRDGELKITNKEWQQRRESQSF